MKFGIEKWVNDVTKNNPNGVIYVQGDADNPVQDDWRIIKDGIFLDFDRYNGTLMQREQEYRIGGSGTIQRLMEIVKDVNADLLVNDNGEIRNLIRSNTFSDGTTVGDIFGPTYLIGKDKIYSAKPVGEASWKVFQSDDTQNFTGTSFYLDFTTRDVDAYLASIGKIIGVSLPSGVKIQLKVYLQSDLVNPKWENVTDIEIANGIGAELDETTGEFVVKPNFYGLKNQDLRIVINTSEEITLKGSNNLGTDIYFESYDVDIKLNELITTPANGGGYFVGPVETSMTLAGDDYKVDTSFTPWDYIHDFEWDETNTRFKYIGEGTIVNFAFDFSCANDTNNTRMTYTACKNGVAIPGSEATIDFINNNKEQRMGINCQISLETNDYLEICVKSDSAGTKAYTSHLQLSIR